MIFFSFWKLFDSGMIDQYLSVSMISPNGKVETSLETLSEKLVQSLSLKMLVRMIINLRIYPSFERASSRVTRDHPSERNAFLHFRTFLP